MVIKRKPDPDKAVSYRQDEKARLLSPAPVTDEQWHAVIGNDAAYDGLFFYAVKTTGIFCRPSCKSKPPNRDNIGCFFTADQALAANYRPCKRCKPTGRRWPDEEWIALTIEYVERNYKDPLTLEALANWCHGTPYHLHRTFKKIAGVTPAEYIQQTRIGKAKELLVASDQPISAVGECVGLRNTPYFITLFKKKTGHTPADYRKQFKQH